MAHDASAAARAWLEANPARAARGRAAVGRPDARFGGARSMAAAQIEFFEDEAAATARCCSAPTGSTWSSTAARTTASAVPPASCRTTSRTSSSRTSSGCARGVWGVLVAGGMFGHATVVAGRRKPHATKHGRAVIARAGDRIMQAEILTRAVCDLCAADGGPDPSAVRRAVGERWWTESVTSPSLERARERLRDVAEQWAGLVPGEAITASWRLPPP